MKTSQAGIDFITKWEGCILGAYDDANDRVVRPGQPVRGTLTIGIGHTSAAGPPKVFVGQRITKVQAQEILAKDLASVERSVSSLITVPLNQNQFDALVSFQYNTGALGKSSIKRYLNQRNYVKAASALLLYDHVGKTVVRGLQRRREAEKQLFEKPVSNAPAHTAAGSVLAGGAGLYAYLQHHPITIGVVFGSIAVAVWILTYLIRKNK